MGVGRLCYCTLFVRLNRVRNIPHYWASDFIFHFPMYYFGNLINMIGLGLSGSFPKQSMPPLILKFK
jgi:hypothetical protein